MRKTWFLVAALALGLTTGRASAAPSFFGPTGLLVIPTADTLAQQSWNLHLHLTEDLTAFGGNFGIAKGLEIGVTGVDPEGGDVEAIFNAKYTALMETATGPGIAIGAIDISDELNLDPGIYVVVSKSLSSLLGSQAGKYNVRGHLGYGWNGIFDDDIFWGLDVQLTEQVQAMVEGIGSDITFGARFGLGQGFRAELASYDGDFGGGISYGMSLR
jgi:hypothetical protein